MEIKRNEATHNRPQGDRVIDAPFVFADLNAFIDQVKDEKAWDKSDRNGITVFKSGGITIVLTALKEGAVIKDNTVDGLLTIQVIEGTVRLETLGGNSAMTKNQLIAFHPGIPHSLEATKDVVLLITNYQAGG